MWHEQRKPARGGTEGQRAQDLPEKQDGRAQKIQQAWSKFGLTIKAITDVHPRQQARQKDSKFQVRPGCQVAKAITGIQTRPRG